MTEKVKTGIEGLDRALNGGFPKGNIILISGGAGTGKSTLCLQYLINGAKLYNEKGLYISTEQTKKEIQKTADSFKWDITSLENNNMLKIVYFDIVETNNFLEKLYELYTTFMPKRIVIDSLTTLSDHLLVSGINTKKPYSLVKIGESVSPIPQSERIIAKNLLYHLMKKLRLFDSTILLTSELLEGQAGLSADQISEFICDGVMVMNFLEVGVIEDRSLIIRKMRYTDHEKKPLNYEINNNGIVFKEKADILKL
ncbi:MAG: ATPase domain-containing protein [Candidatus Diapherotrites archaeon]